MPTSFHAPGYISFSILNRYKGVAEMSKPTSGTFYLLLDLMLFFDQYHNEQYDSALDIIRQLKILPMSLDTVELKVNTFKYYEEEVSINNCIMCAETKYMVSWWLQSSVMGLYS